MEVYSEGWYPNHRRQGVSSKSLTFDQGADAEPNRYVFHKGQGEFEWWSSASIRIRFHSRNAHLSFFTWSSIFLSPDPVKLLCQNVIVSHGRRNPGVGHVEMIYPWTVRCKRKVCCFIFLVISFCGITAGLIHLTISPLNKRYCAISTCCARRFYFWEWLLFDFVCTRIANASRNSAGFVPLLLYSFRRTTCYNASDLVHCANRSENDLIYNYFSQVRRDRNRKQRAIFRNFSWLT